MKEVLILGGTRFFGRCILDAFASRGDRVTVLSRGNRPLPSGLSAQEWLRCDRKDESALRAVSRRRDYDVVIDNICYEVDDAKAAVRVFSGRCGRYIMTSSVMTYLNLYLEGRPLREGDWTRAETTAGMDAQYGPQELEYATRKRQCENEFFSAQGLDAVVMRLPNVVGEDDFSGKSGVLPLAIQPDGKVEFVGHPHDMYQQVSADDLGSAYTRCADAGINQFPRAYNLGAPPIAISRYLEIIAEALGHQADVTWLDPQSEAGNGLPFPKNVIVDCTAIENDLGVRFTSYAAFLPRLTRWYVDQAESR